MKIRELNRTKAMAAMQEWLNSNGELPQVDSSYQSIRENIQDAEQTIRQKEKLTDYFLDVQMGLSLYNYFESQSWFSMRTAANDDFWRYLSVIVVPDVVGRRWGNDNEDHYWKKNSRIWLRQVWWYVYLSWQGDATTTEQVLDSPNFSTDTILNLEERTGRYGTYVNVYRYIMYFYSTLDRSVLDAFNSNIRKNDKHATLFRTVMKLNTAKAMVVEPALYLGGEIEYVRSLFADAGITV